MAIGTVQVKYYLPAEQRDYLKAQATAADVSASQMIDMLIQLWRQLEAGQVVMRQAPAASPYLARLQQIRGGPGPLSAAEIEALFGEPLAVPNR